MNNDSLDRLEMTMRRCDNNMKEIYRRKRFGAVWNKKTQIFRMEYR